MSKKLFVGGLSWGTTDEQLKAAFETYGATEAKVILDQETGRSRGFGFVTCGDEDAAQRAQTELDGSELDGRTIRVNAAEDKPRPPRTGGGGRPGGGGGGRPGGGGGGRSGGHSAGGGGGYSGGGGGSGGGNRSRQSQPQSRRGGGERGGRRDGDDKFARRRSSAQKSRGGRDSGYGDVGDYDPDLDY